MAKSDVFVIPAGLKLELGPDGLIVENDGDIEVRNPLGQRAALLRSALGNVSVHVDVNGTSVEAPHGDVTFATHASVGRVMANNVHARAGLRADRVLADDGEVLLAGAVDIGRVHARRVVFEGGLLRAKVIEATESIRILRGQVTADILIAPEVVLDLGVTGKITVVESHNDLGSIAVRGCLRLSELEELGGNATVFMAERGLVPLGPAPATTPPPPIVPAPVAPAPVIVEVVEDPQTTQGTLIPEVGQGRPLGDEQLDTFVEDDEAPEDDPVHRSIVDALNPILNAYADGDLPPPIAELAAWVQRKDYDAVRDGIANAFLQLNKHHNRQKTPLKPNVTGYFTALNAVVRRLKR